ncbi:MAG: hypothetical protein ACI9J0_003716 [Cryomorphaceae bacterium]|jgi:hypothetical protein
MYDRRSVELDQVNYNEFPAVILFHKLADNIGILRLQAVLSAIP